MRRLLGYVRYDSQAAVQAINDLYANEVRLFRNLFLPSVKLERKIRVGSRTRRIYGSPQTPFERICASPASDPERIAELKSQQQELDPFELSRKIQAKLERIFQLSRELVVRREAQVPAQNIVGKRQVAQRQKREKTSRTSNPEKPTDRKERLPHTTTGVRAMWHSQKGWLSSGPGFYTRDAGEGGSRNDFTPPKPAPFPCTPSPRQKGEGNHEKNSSRVTL